MGNKQIDAFKTWLKTSGIRDKHRSETPLGEIFRIYGTEELLPWQITWINIIFDWATALWYVSLPIGRDIDTVELKEQICAEYSQFSKRTLGNAILELVGLLENTPIGRDLGQGEVTASRPRKVKRTGLPKPADEALIYALLKLFEEEKRTILSLSEVILWPWAIFGCSKEYVLERIIFVGEKWFDVSEDEILLRGLGEEYSSCGYIRTILM